MPLKYCFRKGKKQCTCKADFPKKVLRTKAGNVRPEKYRPRVVCQGVAAEMGLKTSGRRNALGSILGRRRCSWFSGTSALLAIVARSNSNVQCNYRVPLSETTHDKDCVLTQCTEGFSGRSLCVIAQRAMKQMTGYFGGYISKRQKMGKFEMKKSIAALPLMKEKLQQRQLKTASSQLAHGINRMFSILEGKGILRVCTEEFMLSSQYKPHDPLAAEFIRTFRHQHFNGKCYLDRYDAVCEKKKTVDITVLLPRNGLGQDVPDQVSLYGFRDVVPDMFFLSPWEFCQWYYPHRLRAPSATYDWTKLTARGKARLEQEERKDIKWVPGTDFVMAEEKIAADSSLFPYPPWQRFFSHETLAYSKFRQTWILRRRLVPMVPCPERCPLPGRRMSKDVRAKLLSVYFRPWTLVRTVATVIVPYLPDLRKSRESLSSDGTDVSESTAENAARSGIRKSWKEYMQHVLPHAKPQLQNFMLACLAEGKTHAEEEEESGYRRGTSLYCKLSLAEVFDALNLQSKKTTSSISIDQQDTTGKDATSKRVFSTAAMALKLASATSRVEPTATGSALVHSMQTHCRLQKHRTGKKAEPAEEAKAAAHVDTELYDVQQAYEAWCVKTYHRDATDLTKITPNVLQRQVLEMLHDKCVEEKIFSDDASLKIAPAPLRHLIHGLPGSGKSELTRWIQSYFEEVWQYKKGQEFVFLAPMNSMANNIGGSTVHSWGQIGFKDMLRWTPPPPPPATSPRPPNQVQDEHLCTIAQ